MASQIDRALFDKAVDVTATALRGSMGGEGSQPPEYAAQVFREVWNVLREAAQEIQERPKAGF